MELTGNIPHVHMHESTGVSTSLDSCRKLSIEDTVQKSANSLCMATLNVESMGSELRGSDESCNRRILFFLKRAQCQILSRRHLVRRCQIHCVEPSRGSARDLKPCQRKGSGVILILSRLFCSSYLVYKKQHTSHNHGFIDASIYD